MEKVEDDFTGAITNKRTMPNNKTVEIKVGTVDIQPDITISGIKLKLLPARKVTMVRTICFKYLVTHNFNIFQLAENTKMPVWK